MCLEAKLIYPNKKAVSLYRYFIGKFEEHADCGPRQISYNQARWVLGRYAIPACLRQVMINEMIYFGYLKRISQREGLLVVGKPIIIEGNIIIEKHKGGET